MQIESVISVPNLDERDLRYKRLRHAMERQGLDALIVAGKGHWWTGRGYFRYLTDFHLWGHDGLILFPLEGEPMLTLTSAAIADRIGERGWIDDVRGDPDVALEIIDAVKEKGLAQSKIGIVGQRFILSIGTYQLLTSGLSDVEFVDADHLFDCVRMIKSPLEVQQNRELWTLAKKAMESFVAGLECGKTQYQLLAEPVKTVAAGGGRDTLVFYDGKPPENREVFLNDVLSYHMEICGPSGHWCELTVTRAFRDPTERELRLMDSELAAYEEIRKIARPGVSIKELTDAFERVLLEDGWVLAEQQTPHYDFHSQGMDVIEWPFYGPLDTRQGTAVLEEGMIFSYHPGRRVLPDVRPTGINENLLITECGGERLSGDWDLHWRVR